jgi:hypothetical protein
LEDASNTGARLTIEGSVEGLQLREFFLLLSSTGLAYRRCELAWVNGDKVGVYFLKPGGQEKAAANKLNGPAPKNRNSRWLAFAAKMHSSRVGEANMEFPHWLMISGALLVFVGLIGTALQIRRGADDPVSIEQDREVDEQPVSLPKFLS